MATIDKTLILGLGNTILSDDAAGIVVARQVYQVLSETKFSSQVEFAETSYAGWRLIDLIAGYKKLILIDAIQTGSGALGDCYKIERAGVNTLRLQSSHGMDLNTALELAEKSGVEIPQEISIYAVEVKNVDEFAEKMSPEITGRISKIAQEIIQEEFGVLA